MAGNRRVIYTQLACLRCSNILTIPRRISKKKTVGHIKDMYCPYCKEDSKFFEIRDTKFRDEKGEIINEKFLKKQIEFKEEEMN